MSDPTNPYAPPRSEVVPAGAADAPGVGWRLYSGLIAALMFGVVPLMLLFADLGWFTAIDYVDLAPSAVSTLGLLGWVYRWRLLSGRFWRVYLPLVLAWDLAYAYLFPAYGLAGVDPELGVSGTAETTGYLLFALPIYYALFRYGWRSPELWRA